VPLSEHEQRQLEQIEQALYADYPRFANAVRVSDPRVHYKRRLIQAGLGFVLGVGMLAAGVATKYMWVSVAGFVVVLACAAWALYSFRRMTGAAASTRTSAKRKGQQQRRARSRQPSPRMMERLEERWRRRQERDR
jgi:hypothetical protein